MVEKIYMTKEDHFSGQGGGASTVGTPVTASPISLRSALRTKCAHYPPLQTVTLRISSDKRWPSLHARTTWDMRS